MGKVGFRNQIAEKVAGLPRPERVCGWRGKPAACVDTVGDAKGGGGSWPSEHSDPRAGFLVSLVSLVKGSARPKLQGHRGCDEGRV